MRFFVVVCLLVLLLHSAAAALATKPFQQSRKIQQSVKKDLTIRSAAAGCSNGYNCDCQQCADAGYSYYCKSKAECYSFDWVCKALCNESCVSAKLQCGPKKPLWPKQFDAPFGLNVKLFGYHNRSSHLYYNWEIKKQKVHYPNGCLPLVTEKPCDLIFNPSGIYLLAPEAGKPCCMLFPNVGTIPPAFLAPFNFSGVKTKIVDFYGRPHTTNYWTGPEDFAYWTDATNGHDVQFQDGPTGTFWNWGNFNVVSQASSIFDLPNTNNSCAAKCGLLNVKMEHVVPRAHDDLFSSRR